MHMDMFGILAITAHLLFAKADVLTSPLNRQERDWREKMPAEFQQHQGPSVLQRMGHDYASQSQLIPQLISRMDKASLGRQQLILPVAASTGTMDSRRPSVAFLPQSQPLSPHPTSHVIPARNGSLHEWQPSTQRITTNATTEGSSTASTNISNKLAPVRLVLPVAANQGGGPSVSTGNAVHSNVGTTTTKSAISHRPPQFTLPVEPHSGPYVFDMLAAPVTSDAVAVLSQNAIPGVTYPTLTELPSTAANFQCSAVQAKASGYYADTATGCQVFHRCGEDGNPTHYLCPNQTIFNQITLTCDWWYNVNCQSSSKVINYANSRLGTSLPLFDSPPEGFVPKWSASYYSRLAAAADGGSGPASSSQFATKRSASSLLKL